MIDVENQILNAIFEAEERERLHFSSEIHDGLGPAITVLQIYFQWLADSSEENRAFIIEKGNYYFNEVGNILKEIILRHNPSIVENNGISYAINIFISKLNATNKINILFESNFTVRFGLKLEVAIYRIVTELINNTMKYAKATEIVIKLDYDESLQNINLLYTDNGQGMKFENLSCNNLNSFGILYIKSRVRALNGSFHFSNCEQRGVKIEISLPVKN